MTNPLRKYLETHDLKEASEMTNLSKQTLLNISRMLPEDLGGIELRSYEALKNKLGVDLRDNN